MKIIAEITQPELIERFLAALDLPAEHPDQQPVADVTDKDMTGVPDGRFDEACTKFSDTGLWYPPLPRSAGLPRGPRGRDHPRARSPRRVSRHL